MLQIDNDVFRERDDDNIQAIRWQVHTVKVGQ